MRGEEKDNGSFEKDNGSFKDALAAKAASAALAASAAQHLSFLLGIVQQHIYSRKA